MSNGPPPADERKEYLLASGTRLMVVKGSIPDWPKMQLDRPDADKIRPIASVNAANQRLIVGGGVDGTIHKNAGPELLKECQAKPEVRPGIRCPTGEAVVTSGYNLGADYIIHTCGPVYAVDRLDECKQHLSNAYRNSLRLATELGAKVVAFPAISTGVYAYPLRDATTASLTVLKDARPPVQEVWVVLYTPDDFNTVTTVAKEMQFEEYAPSSSQSPPPPPQLLQLPPDTPPA